MEEAQASTDWDAKSLNNQQRLAIVRPPVENRWRAVKSTPILNKALPARITPRAQRFVTPPLPNS